MVIPEFLFYLVTTEEFINMASMAYGTHMPRSDWNLAKNYRLALPGLEEQRAIASALSDVDALISSLDKLIAKKRDIKQAAMQQLLTGRRRLPGFSGRWEERRLEDVAALDSENLGGDTPRDYEFNYVSLEDVNRGILRGYANQLFSSAPSRARRVIRSGDVLVSTVRPNLGSHLLFKSSSPDWICSTGFSVVRCVEDAACPGYVFYHLFGDYVTRQIDAQLTGSSYPAISSKDVGNLRMPFPSIDEQRAIASVLSDMDAEIEALERRRDKTWLLKQGMMQELLTGRVRLV
jgi:type I restriction enzyme S subunit